MYKKTCFDKFWLLIFLIFPTFVVGQECDIFLSYSGFGEGNARSNTVLTNPVVGQTYSVYIWIDENFEIDTGIFLNICACEPGGIQFSDAEVFNPDITIAGAPVFQRWVRKQDTPTILADCVENLDAIGDCATNTGISQGNTGPVFLDGLYDPAENAFLYARIDFVVIDNTVSTEFCCEIGCGLIVHQCESLEPNCCGATIPGGDPPPDPCTFEPDNILCDLDENGDLTGDFVITGIFTNLQEIPGIHLLMLPFANSPPGVELCFGNGDNYWTFDDPLDNGESFEIGEDLSNEGAIIVKNAMPGDEVCFTLTLVGENGVECCTLEVCLIMPPCDCLQIDRRLDEFANIECDGGSNISFDYTFQLTNLFGQDVYHAFLVPLGTETIDPHYFDLNAINNGPVGNGQSVTLTTRITTVNQQPGDKVTFDVIIHNEDLSECCLREHCVTIPDCMSPSMPGPVGDVNEDGVVDFLDVQPFIDLLNSGGYHVKADINGDGVVDFADIDPFIAILSGP